MSLATYSDLKSAIANWTKRADLTSYLDDLITVGETRIHREVYTHHTEEDLNVTIAGDGTAAIPSDYRSLQEAYVDTTGGPDLTQASATQVRRKSYTSGQQPGCPKLIATKGSSFIFWPPPASAYTIKGTYYKNPGTLSSAVYTMFTDNPDLFLYAALCATAPFLKDDKRVAIWETEYNNVKNAVEKAEERYRFGGRLQITAA